MPNSGQIIIHFSDACMRHQAFVMFCEKNIPVGQTEGENHDSFIFVYFT